MFVHMCGMCMRETERVFVHTCGVCMNHYCLLVAGVNTDLGTGAAEQVRQSRSGRPGDNRTNVLTEIASPTLCLQARSPRIMCTDACPHECHGTDVKESWGDLRWSRF